MQSRGHVSVPALQGWQRCCRNCGKLYHSWVVSRKTQSHQDFRNTWSIGETRGVKSWDRSDEYDSQSTLRQASIREDKGPSPGKIQVKLPHQRSPYAMKLENRSQEETERQRAMRPRQGMEPCQKYLQAQRKGQRLHSIRLPMSGVWRPHPPKKRRKESLW